LELKIPNHFTPGQTLFAILQAYRNAPFVTALWTAIVENPELQPSFPAISQTLPEKYHTLDWILGIGLSTEDQDCEPQTKGTDFDFHDFDAMLKANPAFRMGYFAYDMKAHSLGHKASLPATTGLLESAFWFRPSLLLMCNGKNLTIKIDQHQQFLKIQQILSKNPEEETIRDHRDFAPQSSKDPPSKKLREILKCVTNYEEYSQNILEILHQIKEGTFYELNYCIEWFGKYKIENPVSLWKSLTEKSGAPFSAFVKNKSFYALSNSPERFLKTNGEYILSQPIKGTAPRSSDFQKDHQILKAMQNNPKDQAEHLMIVDLVRNDLTRCSDPLSVKVSELCQAYSFPNVHQLISTIQARKNHEQSLADILNACFPMGSMTGAPKSMVCHWIDKLEKKKRGLYSGSIGYIDQEGNMDLNVVIRTLIYDDVSCELSLSAGGAITWDSDPETEWEECQIKAHAILQAEVPA
jgi:para-aminobenzoate synthetase component 1